MSDTSELLTSTDDAPVVDVLKAVAQCAAAWEPGARLLGNVRACDILRAVTHAKSRLQAEAQAPTTAAQASVLTPNERERLTDYSQALADDASGTWAPYEVKWLLSVIDRLTGAPALAPTMPTREQIDECVRTTLIDGLVIADCGCDAFYVGNKPEFVDALVKDLVPSILALIAKGDTP